MPKCYRCCGESNNILSFTHWIFLYPKFEEFRQQFIQFIDEICINFSLIINEKSLKIPGYNEEFVILIFTCVSFFQPTSREFSFPILYFVGFTEFLTNVMPIVKSNFYTIPLDLLLTVIDEWEKLKVISSSDVIF